MIWSKPDTKKENCTKRNAARAVELKTKLYFTCSNANTRKWKKTRKESLEVIRKTLTGKNCPPQIIYPFIEVIHSIVEYRAVEIDNQVCPTVVMAIRDQERMERH